MIAIRACSAPQPSKEVRLPKRLTRIRRAVESKRMDSFRNLHESLRTTAKQEAQFVRDLFDKIIEDPPVETEEDEEKPE